MSDISKGSILKEVTPFIVVPLYSERTIPISSDATITTTKRRIDTDPTHVPNLTQLPQFKACPIWDKQTTSDRIFENPEINKYLRRARRTVSSSSDNTVASWHILCILVTLRVVADNICDQEETSTDSREQDQQNHQQLNDSLITQQPSNNNSSPHWWSVLLSEHYDDDKERKINPIDDDDEDDNYSIIVELWPLIREYIPWKACQRLYRRIQNRLHILTIPHPLTAWAQKTIFELTNDDFETSWKIFQNSECQQTQKSPQPLASSTKESRELSTVTSPSPPNRLHASKLWLDRVANIPERLVGVLVEDPLKIISTIGTKNTCQSKGSLISSNNNNNNDIPSALNLPRCHQSCLPNTCLEVHVVADEEEVPHATAPALENNNKQTKLFCRWVALYDLSGVESENESRTLSTMPKSWSCDCFQCIYEKKRNAHPLENKRTADDERTAISIEITSANLTQAQRLAHSYFHQEAFGDAMSLYQQCHRLCASSNTDCTMTETDLTKSKENSGWLAHIEADLWHTMGAVLLSQRKFARSQQHWKNGSQYKNIHEELSKQLDKQEAYQYFHSHPEVLPTESLYETIHHSERQSLLDANGSTKQSVFIASNVIDAATCRNLIQWALDYALNNGGWTASRHYSVPTTDLPIHQVPNLLGWFQDWMPRVLLPLLRDQFGIASYGDEQPRFYVHDAFLVRYEATSSNRFLPLHYDESTHSCVLAINDDFDGGGSYVYDLKRSIAPPTGGMVSFLGNRCLHGGTPVTRGVRYILAIFLYIDEDLCCNPHQEGQKKTKTNKSLPFPIIDKDEKKRTEEVVGEDNEISKRFKKDEGSRRDEGEGFSFSFF